MLEGRDGGKIGTDEEVAEKKGVRLKKKGKGRERS